MTVDFDDHYFSMDYATEFNEGVKWEPYIASEFLWDESYKVVGLCNILLDGLEEISDKGSVTYKEIYCEATTLRVLMLFNLQKFFGTYNDINSGIPVGLSSIADDAPGRMTQDAVYELLLSQLKSVEALEFPASGWNLFYSRDIVNALYAQIYWYRAESAAKEDNDWEKAKDHALMVLRNKKLIDNANDLKAIFTAKGYTEGVLDRNTVGALVVVNTQHSTKYNM